MATIGTAAHTAQTGGAAPAGGPGETEALTRQLDEHGYALLRDVLPPERVARPGVGPGDGLADGPPRVGLVPAR